MVLCVVYRMQPQCGRGVRVWWRLWGYAEVVIWARCWRKVTSCDTASCPGARVDAGRTRPPATFRYSLDTTLCGRVATTGNLGM